MSSRNFPPSFWNSNYVPPTPPTHHQVRSNSPERKPNALITSFSRSPGFRPLLNGRRLLGRPVARGPLRLVRPRGPRTCRPRARLPPQHGAVRQPAAVTPAVRPHVTVRGGGGGPQLWSFRECKFILNFLLNILLADSTTTNRRRMRWKVPPRTLVIPRWQVRLTNGTIRF